MPRSTRLTRRRFLVLAAAAAVSAPLRARAATTPPRKKSPAVTLPPAKVQKGIAEQKSVLAPSSRRSASSGCRRQRSVVPFRPLRPRRLR
jgi:hypothetical protein